MSLEENVHAFFGYFYQRANNVEWLKEQEVKDGAIANLHAERHVLIAAGLDALGNYWARLFRPDLTKKRDRERFGTFLQLHGDARIFGRCSKFDLWDRVLKDHPTHAKTFNVELKIPPAIEFVDVVTWKQDPTLDAVSSNARLTEIADEEWLRKSLYGEILYTHYRCYWVHELFGSRKVSSMDMDHPIAQVLYNGEPYYENVIGDTRADDHKELNFPTTFLLKTYRNAIASLERACLEEQKDPTQFVE